MLIFKVDVAVDVELGLRTVELDIGPENAVGRVRVANEAQ
jgi:hypothetical protein